MRPAPITTSCPRATGSPSLDSVSTASAARTSGVKGSTAMTELATAIDAPSASPPTAPPARAAGGSDPTPAAGQLATLCLVGNPNVGKSDIFGHLTGGFVTVSNYP